MPHPHTEGNNTCIIELLSSIQHSFLHPYPSHGLIMGRVYSPALYFYIGHVTFLASDIQMEVLST